MINKELYRNMWNTLTKMVKSDGGDGCGTFLSIYADYKEVSKLFKEFNDEDSSFPYFEEYDGYDLFSNRSNENLLVTNDKTCVDLTNGWESDTIIY